MSKIIPAAAFVLASVSSLSAKTVYYPQTACAEIVSAEYSSGGGDTAFNLYEILCKDKDGKYTSFVTSWTTVSGLLGFGRVFYDEVINLVPYDGDKLQSE